MQVPFYRKTRHFLQPCPRMQGRGLHIDFTYRRVACCAPLHRVITVLFADGQIAKIKILSVSCTGIESEDIDLISYLILQFPLVEDLDVSSNTLDTAAINRMVSTFSGNTVVVTRVSCVGFVWVCVSVGNSLCLLGKCTGNNVHSLNLSGTSIEKLPDDIMKCLPNLKSLKLNDCRALVFLPLSLARLKKIEVSDCASLIYPPSSVRQTPEKVLQFLRDVDPTSEPWRRLKVTLSTQQHHLSYAA